MLRSEHLRGISKEMKRASILLALDAARISLDEVVDDAKARLEATDSYESSQRRQLEAHLVRRAEKSQQIKAELERVKATYADQPRRGGPRESHLWKLADRGNSRKAPISR
jgi:hypothetical protein